MQLTGFGENKIGAWRREFELFPDTNQPAIVYDSVQGLSYRKVLYTTFLTIGGLGCQR